MVVAVYGCTLGNKPLAAYTHQKIQLNKTFKEDSLRWSFTKPGNHTIYHLMLLGYIYAITKKKQNPALQEPMFSSYPKKIYSFQPY